MANASEIADLITRGIKGPQGPEDSAFHTGIVRSWDVLSGANTVEVNGVILPNLKALTAGIGVRYSAGDTVVLVRKQTQFFIMGRVSAPGGSSGSAIRGRTENDSMTITTLDTWFPFPVPVVLQTYASSNSWMLILLQAGIRPAYSLRGEIGFKVTNSDGTVFNPGALTGTTAWNENWAGVDPGQSQLNDSTVVLQYAAGPAVVKPGLVTVELMARIIDRGGFAPVGRSCLFQQPGMTLIPL
jgi:hypothetical protein